MTMAQYNKMMDDVFDFFNKELPALGITKETLNKPSSESVKKIYSALLLHGGILTKEQLMTDSGSSSIADESLMGGVCAIKLYKAMEYFTQNIMQDSTWSINDLSNPNNRRTLMIIHKLIGFFLFAEERYSEMEEIFKEQDRRGREEWQFQLALHNLEKVASQKLEDLEQRRATKQKLCVQRNERILLSGQARTSRTQVSDHYDVLKAGYDEKEHALTSLREQVHEMENSNKDLRGKMVKSPGRLDDEIKKLMLKNSETTDAIQKTEASINQMNQQISILKTDADPRLNCFKNELIAVQNDDTSALASMKNKHNEHLTLIDREKSAATKLKEDEKKLSGDHEDAIENIESELKRCQNNIEHLKALTEKNNLNNRAYVEKIEQARGDYFSNQKCIEEHKRALEARSMESLKSIIQSKEEAINAEEDNNRVKKDIIELDSGFPNLLKAYQDAQQLGQLLRKTSSP